MPNFNQAKVLPAPFTNDAIGWIVSCHGSLSLPYTGLLVLVDGSTEVVCVPSSSILTKFAINDSIFALTITTRFVFNTTESDR